MKLWKELKKENVENPPALLLTILKHKSLDYLKAREREVESYTSMLEWQQRELTIRISNLEACDPDFVFSKEIHSIVQKTLQKLPDQTQRVFIMSRKENKTVKEIAEIMGISVKGVDYHIAKALKVLRIALKDYLPLYLIWLL